jgi:hypothetical protein
MLNDNLLNALKTAKPKELKFVASVLDRSIKKGISIYEAAKIEKYQPGTKVTFNDKIGNQHIAIVEKVMTKRIRLFDKTTKSIVNIYPQQLRTYVPKTYAPRLDAEKVKEIEPRTKRKYVRKAQGDVDISALLKKYEKDTNVDSQMHRTKRKYVRKVTT